MRTRCTMAILAMLAAVAACKSTRIPDPARAEADIRATDARWLAAAQARDLKSTLSYWSDDAMVMPPGGPPLVGKEAIRRYVTGAFAIPDFSITWVTDRVRVASSGDLAYVTGTDRISMTSPEGQAVVEHNKAIGIWRKEPDGSWKCAVDMWNSAASQ